MIILETQHVSQLQRGGTGVDRLVGRLAARGDEEIGIAIITPFEQLRECLGRINAASQVAEQVRQFAFLARLLEFYTRCRWRLLPFDQAAAVNFQGFSKKLIREIGGMDARIAAITLAQGATLLSVNVGDFRRVPGLRVEDWLRD